LPSSQSNQQQVQTTTQTITEDLEKNVVEIVTVEETEILDGTEQQKSSSSDKIQQQNITVEQKSTISNRAIYKISEY
jgi:hypothetical protein